MARLSMSDIWGDARAFLRAELPLLLPIAFATFGVAMLGLILVVPPPVENQLPPGPWMFWLIPLLVLNLIGMLAVTVLTLTPHITVREAIATAMARLPTGLLAMMIWFFLQSVLLLLVGIVAQIEASLTGKIGPLASVANLVVLGVLIWLSVRLLPLWPVVVDRHGRAVPALRESFALTKGYGWRLLLVSALAAVAAGLVILATVFAGGSVLTLLGHAAGAPDVAAVLRAVLFAAVLAVVILIWVVFLACLYRRLQGSSSGI